jgi:endonuclease YncB( thermonuclease family)
MKLKLMVEKGWYGTSREEQEKLWAEERARAIEEGKNIFGKPNSIRRKNMEGSGWV